MPTASGGAAAQTTTAQAGRADTKRKKVYHCRRCGAPKLGHVCTVPGQRIAIRPLKPISEPTAPKDVP